MHVRIAKTFTDNLARLGPQAQTAGKTAAFDLQVEPDRPALNLHPVKRARDLGVHSVRLDAHVARTFPFPETGRIAVNVINHFGDAVMPVFGVRGG